MARACRIPTEAEEDWITAVKAAPARIPRIGFENWVINRTKSSESRRGIMESLIIPIPIKRTPIPAIMPPMCWAFLFLKNTIGTTPTKAIRGARAPISKAMSCPVMVVPMLAPMIIHMAWFKVIRPEFTNPTTMTVVAEEDWIIAVIPAPTKTPKNRFAVSRSRICFMRLPATASRFVLIICIP